MVATKRPKEFVEFARKNKLDMDNLIKSTPFFWIWGNGFLNENDQPMEFNDHSFLIQPLQDEHPDIVTMKSAQIGWSVVTIFTGGYYTAYRGLNCIHTLPTQNVIKDFVVPKVNPLISKNPEFKRLLVNDSLSLKKFGDRFVYFRGSFKETDAISITADVLFNDEYDRSDQHVLQVYQSRLQASKYAWVRRFSNPSLMGFGVHELWQDSDQMHWFIKCHHCNKKQYLIWPDNIDIEKQIYICRHCQKELSYDDRKNGEWVAKYPKKTHRRGYWISQLMVPYVKASYIIEQSKKDPQFFHNFVLGLPYSEAEILVNRESIIKCLAPGDQDLSGMCLGVDNGVVKHWVMGNKNGIYRYGQTKSWDDIERLIQATEFTVIDANPYPVMPKQFADKYRGKVFLNYYTENTTTFEIAQWGKKKEMGVIKSDRTRLLDHVAKLINMQEMLFFLTATQLDEYIEHWQNIYRGEETNARGIRRGVWVTKEARPDHFVHATAYYRLAVSQTLTKRGQVVTPKAPLQDKGDHPTVNKDFTIKHDIDPAKAAKMAGKKSRGWKEV